VSSLTRCFSAAPAHRHLPPFPTRRSSDLGRSAAKAFASHGATVILLGRTIAKLEAVYDEIEAAGGPQPAIIPLNLEGATYRDYEDVAVKIEETFGRLDGLLHNASLLGARTPLEHYDPDQWTQVMQVNLTAPFLLTKALLSVMDK